RDLVERIAIGDDTLAITLRRGTLISRAQHASDREDDAIGLVVPFQLRRRGVEMKLVIPAEAQRTQPARPDPALIKAVARGHLWCESLTSWLVASPRDIAQPEGIPEGYVVRLL